MARNTSSVAAALPLPFLLLLISAAPAREQVLYRFAGGSDGSHPFATMIADSAGNLYGTTDAGGGGNCASGCGTVFELSPPQAHGNTWTETVLYRFQGNGDGTHPDAPLIADDSGNLFGATSQGGTGNCDNVNLVGCGTVFELQRHGDGWVASTLYNFQGVPDGRRNGDLAWPNGLVFSKAGAIYGFAYDGGHCTTDETGTHCSGGAFTLKQRGDAWQETVIYRFTGPTGAPAGPVFGVDGDLYGAGPGGAFGLGAVFRLAPPEHGAKWTEASLYDFQGGSDGAFPLPGLVFDSIGNPYGVTLGTGSGTGNVFELSPAGPPWTESVLYNFSPIRNGYVPTVGPVFGQNGDLYGTTSQGGKSGFGAVYALAPNGGSWSEKVVQNFAGGGGGAIPGGGVTVAKGGALYGTTRIGGDSGCGDSNGCGTIFKVMP